MTIAAIAKLAALNLFVLGVGLGVLLGIRGSTSWRELLRLSGVAYMSGVAVLVAVVALELVLGVPFRPVTVLATGCALAAFGVVVGLRRGRAAPESPLRAMAGPMLAFSTLAAAAIAVYLESLFRVGRLSGLGWDDWSSWLPRAEVVYFFDGLDAQLLSSLPGASYPPGLTILSAAAFHAMGVADASTLHLQYWFLAVAFAAALVGLLSARVRPWMLWPSVLLVLVMPDIRVRVAGLYGDVPLGYFIALGALLMLLWIWDSGTWKLAAASLMLGGAMLTKREGILFALCVVIAALVATFGSRRRDWPRIGIAGLVSAALAVPWRVWFASENLPSDAPESGYLGFLEHMDRVWPSLRLVAEVFFDYDLWWLVPTLGVASIALALLVGFRREGVFALVAVVTSLVACAWSFWTNPSLEIGTGEGVVNRVVGTPVLMLGVLTPVLLELAWRGQERVLVQAQGAARHSARFGVAALVVALALVAYPALTLAGGRPSFPSGSDCVRSAVEGQPARVVFGYRDTFPDAIQLRDRALEVGFQGVQAAADGCGRVRVFLDDIPSLRIGREIVHEARSVQLDPTLELDPD